MPDWLVVIVLGIIEGVTEFLPISSTGHLLLAQGWLRNQSELFTVVIQSGAVLAVILVFTKRVKQLILEWRKPETLDYLGKLAVAFAVTVAGGLILKKTGFTLDSDPPPVIPVALATLIGGVLILVIERAVRGKEARTEVTWTIAVLIGCAQLLAMAFPGTSRSGASILCALAFGLTRPAAAEFSFLLGIPTLLAAGGYEILSAVLKGETAGVNWTLLALGTIVSAITAFAVVKWLLRFIQTHTFVGFGWYRIALGAGILLLHYR